MSLVYTAVRKFGPGSGQSWRDYVRWNGLNQLDELVTMDTSLCPYVLRKLEPEDWEHNIDMDFRIFMFRNLKYLLKRVGSCADHNILGLLEEPTDNDMEGLALPGFVFKGFDLVDEPCDISALTSCGGFPAVFKGEELNRFGLLDTLSRAREVQTRLRTEYPERDHTHCRVWAIWRLENAS